MCSFFLVLCCSVGFSELWCSVRVVSFFGYIVVNVWCYSFVCVWVLVNSRLLCVDSSCFSMCCSCDRFRCFVYGKCLLCVGSSVFSVIGWGWVFDICGVLGWLGSSIWCVLLRLLSVVDSFYICSVGSVLCR